MADNEIFQGERPQPSADAHDVGLSDSFIREIRELLEHDYTDRIQELCRELAAPDTADLLVKVRPEERHRLAEILEHEIDPETFLYLDEDILNDLFQHMPGPQIAGIVGALDSDDAISLIYDLDEDRRGEIMRSLSRKVRAVVEEGLTFPEYTAGRIMQREFVAIPQFWTVGKTADYLRAAADSLPQKFYDVFIVDPMHKFVGEVGLSQLLRAPRSAKIDTLLDEDHAVIPAAMDQEQVAHLFRRNDLLSAPVVDENGRLIGVITVDDIVDVIDEEAEDDLLKLGGVTDTDIYRTAARTAKSRASWLGVNLVTAFISAGVISMFKGSIEQVVALAILMPIVASMGGNAGTQTLTVAVRALATKELSAANAWRVIGKECVVGIINGLLFACLLGLIVFGWFQDAILGGIIAAALTVNLFVAGLFGAMVPIALDRMGLDPAPAAGVLLTTITDVVGFCSFLGLATWLLL
jgi:magnesium transporter